MPNRSTLVRSGISPGTSQAIVGFLQDSQVATGADQAGAFALLVSHTVFGTTAAGTGARIRSDLGAADTQRVANLGANTLKVYPPVGGTIDGGAANASVNVLAGKSAIFICRDNLNFYSQIGA